jgi:hypothetical protein
MRDTNNLNNEPSGCGSSLTSTHAIASRLFTQTLIDGNASRPAARVIAFRCFAVRGLQLAAVALAESGTLAMRRHCRQAD